MWWMKHDQATIAKELELASHTAVDWCSFCREVAIDIALDQSTSIGGPGTINEVDECTCSKSRL